MTALKVIGIILLILLLIGLLRVGAEVRFGEALVVKLRVGPFRRTIVPMGEKPPKKRKEKEVPDEPAAEKPKKKRSLPKPTLRELTDLASTAFSALGAMLRATCRRLRIDPLEVSVTFGGADPAEIAQKYGYACAAMWALMPRAETLFRIPHPSLHLRMDYQAAETRAEGSLGLSARVGQLLVIALALAVPLLKWFLRFKKAHRDDAPRSAEPPAQAGAAEQTEKTEKLSA